MTCYAAMHDSRYVLLAGGPCQLAQWDLLFLLALQNYPGNYFVLYDNTVQPLRVMLAAEDVYRLAR